MRIEIQKFPKLVNCEIAKLENSIITVRLNMQIKKYLKENNFKIRLLPLPSCNQRKLHKKYKKKVRI
ncbi:MAG: hypothetical protein HZA00_09950 [Nitrospinae bacterium]|nr:hypothetical protein [Nitrospinota bacterium]